MASTTEITLATAPSSNALTLATVANTASLTLATVANTVSLTIATAFVISTDRVFNSRFSDRFKKT